MVEFEPLSAARASELMLWFIDFRCTFASDFKEAVKECNNTHYGLQSGIFTKDLNKAFYAFEHMEVIHS